MEGKVEYSLTTSILSLMDDPTHIRDFCEEPSSSHVVPSDKRDERIKKAYMSTEMIKAIKFSFIYDVHPEKDENDMCNMTEKNSRTLRTNM